MGFRTRSCWRAVEGNDDIRRRHAGNAVIKTIF